MRSRIFATSIFITAFALGPLPSAAQSDAQRAQERYNKYKQQQQDQQALGTREIEQRRSIEAQIGAIPTEIDSEERLRVFCRTTLQSPDLSQATRSGIIATCRNKLDGISLKKAAQADTNKERDSEAVYAGLVAKLEAMPPTEETVRELRRLKRDNNYRLPNLSFSYQNSYFAQISNRLSQIENDAADRTCGELVVSKLSVPAAIKGSVIIDRAVSLTQFLCGALVSSNKVTIAASTRSLEIRIDDFNLQFGIVRYLDKQGITVPMESPIQGGMLALSLESAKVAGKEVAIGNPKAFVTNFYSQWTPQLGAYLAQHSQ